MLTFGFELFTPDALRDWGGIAMAEILGFGWTPWLVLTVRLAFGFTRRLLGDGDPWPLTVAEGTARGLGLACSRSRSRSRSRSLSRAL